eukprot:GHVS01070188.1.p1 GENE.GHVS01070188.1~~GHVS01070188.1.p1  ORF type:complete len:457 (+),score=120.59 GHVS01070188.1:37-1407(+)
MRRGKPLLPLVRLVSSSFQQPNRNWRLLSELTTTPSHSTPSSLLLPLNLSAAAAGALLSRGFTSSSSSSHLQPPQPPQPPLTSSSFLSSFTSAFNASRCPPSSTSAGRPSNEKLSNEKPVGSTWLNDSEATAHATQQQKKNRTYLSCLMQGAAPARPVASSHVHVLYNWPFSESIRKTAGLSALAVAVLPSSIFAFSYFGFIDPVVAASLALGTCVVNGLAWVSSLGTVSRLVVDGRRHLLSVSYHRSDGLAGPPHVIPFSHVADVTLRKKYIYFKTRSTRWPLIPLILRPYFKIPTEQQIAEQTAGSAAKHLPCNADFLASSPGQATPQPANRKWRGGGGGDVCHADVCHGDGPQRHGKRKAVGRRSRLEEGEVGLVDVREFDLLSAVIEGSFSGVALRANGRWVGEAQMLVVVGLLEEMATAHGRALQKRREEEKEEELERKKMRKKGGAKGST